MAYVSQPTDRSPGLLLSIPQEILQSIFDFLLTDELYNADKHGVYIYTSLSCRVMCFHHLVRGTRDIRGVCSTWASAARGLVFRGKSTRRNLVLMLPCLLSEEGSKTFPLLRDCMVQLCHPYWLPELCSLQQVLATTTGSLEYVCAVVWESDDTMDCMMGRINSMGYTGFGREMVTTFAEESIAAGLPIADCDGKCPNGNITESGGSEQFKDAAIESLTTFFFKELLALWYYNAHMVREILSPFPCLRYLELPDFLHVPLLAKIEYFFPQCPEDTSPFAPVSFAPPQMLQKLGITYRACGRRYSDIIGPLEFLSVLSPHYNPILALFNFRNPFGYPSVLIPLVCPHNRWLSDGARRVGGVIRKLRRHVSKAVSEIPERKVPPQLDIRVLRHVMDDPTDD